MKTLLVLGLALSGAVGAKFLCCGSQCFLSPEPGVADVAPFGAYVEARNASVFGGACHYNGELTTQGQTAVLAWRLDGGVYHGVTLAGVEIAAAVGADENLKSDAAREAVIYVDAQAQPAQREAAVRWLRETHGAKLGEVLAVETVALEVASDGEHFRAKVGDAFEVCGSAMPDRECCKMPYNVWYEPFEALDGRLVAATSHFAFREARLGASFERSGHNDAFLGAVGPRAESAFGGCCAPDSACAAQPACAPVSTCRAPNAQM
jgi:hypothetical protein